MQNLSTEGIRPGPVLRAAGLFGLFVGGLWAIRFGWAGIAVGLGGALLVVVTALIARRAGWRIALIVFTLAMFLGLMFGASRALGPVTP